MGCVLRAIGGREARLAGGFIVLREPKAQAPLLENVKWTRPHHAMAARSLTAGPGPPEKIIRKKFLPAGEGVII
jgi:hypothetical protein